MIRLPPRSTLFPYRRSSDLWKRWLGYTARPKGRLMIDAGARGAVEKKGSSLLPIGMASVHGSFAKGDVVALCHPDRKSTRLNSSHEWISYAVFCLKKKKREN